MICLSDLDEGSQKDLADHGIVSVEVNDVVRVLEGQSASKPCPLPRKRHPLSREFAVMFVDVVDDLDRSVDMARLKYFLDCCFHNNIMLLLRRATKVVVLSQFMNFILLEDHDS